MFTVIPKMSTQAMENGLGPWFLPSSAYHRAMFTFVFPLLSSGLLIIPCQVKQLQRDGLRVPSSHNAMVVLALGRELKAKSSSPWVTVQTRGLLEGRVAHGTNATTITAAAPWVACDPFKSAVGCHTMSAIFWCENMTHKTNPEISHRNPQCQEIFSPVKVFFSIKTTFVRLGAPLRKCKLFFTHF